MESRLKYIFTGSSSYKMENTGWDLEDFWMTNLNKAREMVVAHFPEISFSWCEMQKVPEIYLWIYFFYWQFMTRRKMLRVMKNSNFV